MVALNRDRAGEPVEADAQHEATCPEYEAEVAAAHRKVLERDFVGAGAQLQHAASLDLRRPEAFNLLGVIELVRGRRLDALRWWRIALLLDGTYRPAQDNLERVVRSPLLPGGLNLGAPDRTLGKL